MTLSELGLSALVQAPRLLIQAPLRPVQGVRFQPASFPETGPAYFSDPDGVGRVLVESVQSVANHLEGALWEPTELDLVPSLQGLSYVRVLDEYGDLLTASVLEPHRLDSPYVRKDGQIPERLHGLLGPHLDARALPEALYRLDVGCLLHGVFLQSLGSRLRLPRALGGYVEAVDAHPVELSGAKHDALAPAGTARNGYGPVLFHREEFVARSIYAYLSFDLDQLRAYRLDERAFELLVLLGLYEVTTWLSVPLRLRARCDLVLSGPLSMSPDVSFPTPSALRSALAERIANDPRFEVTEVVHPRPATS